MTDPVDHSFRARLADKTGDSRKWTPADALRELLGQIERGELDVEMLYVATRCATAEPNKVDYFYKCAGGGKLDYLGLLTKHTHMLAS